MSQSQSGPQYPSPPEALSQMVAPSTCIAASIPNMPRSTSNPAPIAIGTGRTLFAPTAVVPTVSVPCQAPSTVAGSAASAGDPATPRNTAARASLSSVSCTVSVTLPDARRVDQRFVVEQLEHHVVGADFGAKRLACLGHPGAFSDGSARSVERRDRPSERPV